VRRGANKSNLSNETHSFKPHIVCLRLLLSTYPMTICEHCGRAHLVKNPDLRFCSVLCRLQHAQFLSSLADSAPEEELSALDYQRTHAATLAAFIVSVVEDAQRVLAATPALSTDPELDLVNRFILSVSEDVPTATEIHRFVTAVAAQESLAAQ